MPSHKWTDSGTGYTCVDHSSIQQVQGYWMIYLPYWHVSPYLKTPKSSCDSTICHELHVSLSYSKIRLQVVKSDTVI